MLKRAALILTIVYTILLGATYDGILNAQRRLIDVILVGVLVLVWLWNRRNWRWHRTPLDWAMVLWGAAFALSLLTNLDVGRRIAIGLWFVGLYVGIWYALQDALANRALRREWLVDGVLFAGVPVVFVGFAQVEQALTGGTPIPRPVGTLGNANALAAFLVMLIPLTAGRFADAKTPLARVLLGVYCIGTLLLTLLTYSRGGWLGAAVSVAVWVGLRFPVRRWWAVQSRALRASLILIAALALIGGVLFLVQSFGTTGRTLDLRVWIYNTGLQLFAERPLTGHGLFTFGAGLARLNSMPPFEPHSHAHNVLLHVAAELGIVGLAALAVTAWLIVRAARRPVDATAIMGTAAFAGFVAHQMVDFPAMLPTIALAALIVLVVAIPAGKPVARTRWRTILIAAGGLALIAFGLWNTLGYSAYVTTLSEGLASGDYRTAAERLQPIAESDPAFPVYWQQQGMLLGWAASEGDAAAAREAIDRFQHVTTLAPEYVSGWANLAALYATVGETAQAEAVMRRAVELAPQSWSLVYRYAALSEANGDADGANQFYVSLVTANPDITLLPGWNDSPLRSALKVDESELSTIAQTLLLLERGEIDAARQFWHASGAEAGDFSNIHVINMLFALIDGNRAQAQAEYQSARWAITESNARIWTYTGAAFLSGSAFDPQIAAARAALTGSPLEADWEFGANINYIQFLSLTMPRQFLPQVGYTEVDPVLVRLLNSPDALTALRALIVG